MSETIKDGQLKTDCICVHKTSADPSVNDDSSLGFRLGSEWLNEITGKWFKCDNPLLDNAVWTQIN